MPRNIAIVYSVNRREHLLPWNEPKLIHRKPHRGGQPPPPFARCSMWDAYLDAGRFALLPVPPKRPKLERLSRAVGSPSYTVSTLSFRDLHSTLFLSSSPPLPGSQGRAGISENRTRAKCSATSSKGRSDP